MDFVFTVCDNAAREICPVWPGQPITAHWGMPDPGATLGDAVRLTVFTTEMGAFAEINEVYESFFESDPPARVTILTNSRMSMPAVMNITWPSTNRMLAPPG